MRVSAVIRPSTPCTLRLQCSPRRMARPNSVLSENSTRDTTTAKSDGVGARDEKHASRANCFFASKQKGTRRQARPGVSKAHCAATSRIPDAWRSGRIVEDGWETCKRRDAARQTSKTKSEGERWQLIEGKERTPGASFSRFISLREQQTDRCANNARDERLT